MEDKLVGKGGKKGYITERNGRSSWELQGIVAFRTCQWNELMFELTKQIMDLKNCIYEAKQGISTHYTF